MQDFSWAKQSACQPPCGWPQALGHPQANDAAGARLDIKILKNKGFVVGYDRNRRAAAWVGYRVTPIYGYDSLPRPKFVKDPRLEHKAPRKGYKKGYDRGHLAPNYVISQLYGAKAQTATFYYSNVRPQSARLNQLLWQRLEEIEADYIAPRVKEFWVLVGPIYKNQTDRIPEAFFRIWVTKTPQGWQMMAFRMPQDVRGDERLDRYLVSVKTLERQTGLDFYPKLKNSVRPMDQPADALQWQFNEVSCMPARYQKRWQGRDGIQLDFDRCD